MIEKVSIFVTRLPLTYLNAVEAQAKFCIPAKNSILVVLYRDINDIDTTHIKKLLDTTHWREVHYLPYNVPALLLEKGIISSNTSSSQFYRLRYVKQFVAKYHAILRRYVKVENVFLGDYHIPSMRHIVNVIQPEKTILLDEGFNVYRVFNKLKKRYESPQRVMKLYKFVQYFIQDTLFGYRMYDLENLCFFTSYKLESCNNIHIISNQYEHIRKSIKVRATSSNVYFLGQSLSEIGAMEESTYLTYLSDVSKYFYPNELIYIPHRGDNPDKLVRIEREVGLRVKNFDMPIEFILCASDEPLPKAIAGFNSTALQNINNIFEGNMAIYAFQIKLEDVIFEKREMFDSYYNYLKSLSSSTFCVVDLEKPAAK